MLHSIPNRRKPNNSFKPTLLHGRKFFRYGTCSIAAVQQRGLTQVLGLMKHIIAAFAFFILVCPASSFADIRIHAHSFKNNADLTLDPVTGKLKTASASSFITEIDHFTIKEGTLFYNGQPAFKATEILAQSAADGTDVVVVRVETLGLGNPLTFLAGHPKQISKIVAAGFRNGHTVWQHRIAKEAYSGKWQASISSPEA